MYLLQLCDVRKIAMTEAKRDALIALGYTEVKQPESKSAPPDITEVSGGKLDQTEKPKEKAKAK